MRWERDMIPLFLVVTTFASIFGMAGGYIGLTLEKNPSRINKTVCWVSTISFLASTIIIITFY